jgi:trimeric autotransporter adhesin
MKCNLIRMFLFFLIIQGGYRSSDVLGVTDADWIALNGGLMQGRIYSQAWVNNELYVAGSFTHIAGIEAHGIAKWDRHSWTALNKGANGGIVALASDRAGNIYICGQFDSAGGIPALNVAKWNGQGWSALGPGLPGKVSALAIDKNNILFAGGTFSTAGADSLARNIAQWNGNSWSCVAGGTEHLQPTGWYVTSLAIDSSNNLYIGGSVYSPTCDRCQNAFATRWNVQAQMWDISYYAAGIKSMLPYNVDGIAVDHKGNVYLSGSDLCRRSPTQSDWTIIQSGWAHSVISFDDSDNVYTQLILGDSTTLEKWDGSKWTSIVTSLGRLFSVTFDSQGTLFAAGDFNRIGRVFTKNLATWDKQTWKPVIVNGIDDYVSFCAVDSRGALFIAGEYTSAFGYSADSAVLTWDGAAWKALPVGPAKNPGCMAFDPTDNLYASSGWSNKIGKWDGRQWTDFPGTNYTISSMAFDKNRNLYVGGNFPEIGDDINGKCVAQYIAKWDGSKWYPLGDGFESWVHSILVLPSGEVIAAGSLPDSDTANFIKKWNGSTWQLLGRYYRDFRARTDPASMCFVRKLVADCFGNIYAAGAFDSINGVACKNIAKWDGNRWAPLDAIGLPTNFNDIYDVAADSMGNIYIMAAGLVGACGIARWNGKTWTALGSGIATGGHGCLTYDNVKKRLYAGGDFMYAGGKFTPYIAACDLSRVNPVMRPTEHRRSVAAIKLSLVKATLIISGAGPLDRVCLYSLSGQNLYQGTGKTHIALDDYAAQSFIVRVTRGRADISSGILHRQ